MGAFSTGRAIVGLTVIGLLAGLVWWTMEPGKFQQITWLLLGVCAARILMDWMRRRKIDPGR